MSLRDQILSVDDSRAELVEVEPWGVKVLVRSMDGATRAHFIATFVDVETGTIDYERMYPSLVIASTFDPDTGEKVFTEADMDALGHKNGAALESVAIVAARLCGLDAGAVSRAKSDFGSTPSAGTTST